jgi:flagellar hook-associated protein 2
MSEIGWNFFSDIDYQSILDKYREALETQYLKPIEDKATDINKKNAAVLDVQESLNNFKSTVEDLFSDTGVLSKKVTVSDESILSASITDEVATGIYYVKVNRIATVDQWLSDDGVDDLTKTVLYAGDTFSFEYNGTPISITAESDMTLDELIDAINQQADENGLHVSASRIYVDGEFKLMLTGEDTGADYTIDNISYIDNGDDNDSFLETTSYTHIQQAQDAEIEFGDGTPVTITSSKNTFELVEGLTIDLKNASSSQVIIEVENDKDALKEKIHQFVDAYNELIDKIGSYTDFDEDTYETGPLFGESYVADLKAALIDLVLTNVDVDATFYEDWGGDDNLQELHNLSQLGIDFDSEGHLEVQDYKLDWYLENHFDAVKKLFTAEGGLIDKVTEKIERITDPTTGFIALILNTYQSKLDLYKSQYDKAQEEIDKKIEKMQQEFLQLEQIKSQMEQMQNTLKAYFDVGKED